MASMIDLDELRKENRELIEAHCTDQSLKKQLFRWLEHDLSGPSLMELRCLIKQNAEDELKDRFVNTLQFGTAGIRASMGCGFNRINLVTVCHIAQGMCVFLRTTYGPEKCAESGILIGYDGRHNSKKYAHLVAGVMLSKGVKVFLFGRLVATPLVSYATKSLQCLAGIMVTASHNPRHDNGIKMYTSRGIQLVAPEDKEVAECIAQNQSRWEDVSSFVDKASGLLVDIGRVTNPFDTVKERYMTDMTTLLCRRFATTSSSNLKCVYTPLHGVGDAFVKELLPRFGYTNLQTVEDQRLPDPDFTTVQFPNPEEKGALNLAMQEAEIIGAKLVIANDPDADRFAAAERQPDGSWRVLTGDELGVLFADYRLRTLVQIDKVQPSQMLFMCSVVSSRMLQKMALSEGAQYDETLTGFKWVSRRALELEDTGLKPVLFYEEALGYALTTLAPDKDGVTAAAVFMEMACHLESEGKTVVGKLTELKELHGFFVSNNSYYISYQPDVTRAIFEEFRNKNKYKTQVGEFKIKRIRDATTGYDNGEAQNKCKLPLTPNSEMITLYFENGAVITLRTSGTEPKIKYYAEMCGKSNEETAVKLKKVVDTVVSVILQPQKNGLKGAEAL
eukprot:GHVN01065372.1.p1 GENE.GHVN01065372.1~~GHVN01065372.1.p1  ORF type:complete len:618 (-),score=71.40 GHVN01065372.1:170-2023(-)